LWLAAEEEKMQFFGRLKRSKQGVGSIIGGVFISLILLTGYTFYFLNVNVTEGYNKILQDMGELDLKRNKENLEFISVSFNNDQLNISVKNTGSYDAHLIWLGIFDETVTSNTQEYYEIDFHVDPAETVPDIRNVTIPTFEGQERVIQLVTELGNTFSYSYPPPSVTGIYAYDFVDQEGDPPTVGSHSLFSAQQHGSDGICDTLTEANTGSLSNTTAFSDGFETNDFNLWTDGGTTTWVITTGQKQSGTYSATCGPANDGYLTSDNINMTGATSIYLSFWIRDDDLDDGDGYLYFYDGTTYDRILDLNTLTPTEDTWTFYGTTITDSRYFISNFRIQFYETPENGENCWLDDVTINKIVDTTNYELDLEVQWTNANYDEAYKWLCIYGGTMGSEHISVYVWSGTDWIKVLEDLESGWNNADVSSYLTSSTFKIRFTGGTETGDVTEDEWEIDATFLHTWS
jgi:hypothetical protein